ncbi:uroporphyrinogen-III C-methyltransferase [Jatrophihabitans fulvus]
MTGHVTLVGGGPGADDLITVRGLDRLLAADVVIYDRLGPTSLLDRLGPDVERIDAARAPGRRTLTYDEIAGLMVERARAGKHVVRLKGGDPFVFAHGAQEVASCTEAGVPVEVVPGVTSATGAAVLAGVPLTSTVGAVGFSVVSGHLAPDDPANRLDWTALARSGTTIVVLMGMRHLTAMVERLRRDGVPGDAPCACIADASLPTQRHVTATLDGFADAVARAGLSNPAVLVVDATHRPATSRRVLVLGGSRSGKSRFAESLAAASDRVTYVATAPDRPDDAEWQQRVTKHRERRPDSWRTVETGELAAVLAEPGLALVDSVTTWLARAMDETGVWESGDRTALDARVGAFVDAFAAARDVVAVSDEVGSGIVPATPSGRLFRDVLGELNQRLAAVADEVHLVTAGIARRLA